MPTYLDLRTRVVRDLWRVPNPLESPYDEDVKSAVTVAVLKYQSEPFWFNEQDWVLTATISGQDYYPLPDDCIRVDNVHSVIGGRKTRLVPLPEPMLDRSTADTGEPRSYCVINKQYRLAPRPNGAYALNMTGVRAVPAPENDGDENEWTTEAFDLIAWSAEASLWAGIKKDAQQAIVCQQMAAGALDNLRRRTRRYKPMPAIQPMAWAVP